MTDRSRPYRSTVRDEQSRATRRRIVDAGGELFVAHGYVPTTIDAIAERAGVSRRTVFTSVGSKAVVLKLAFDWTLAGDDEPVAIADRPEVQRMMAGEDPAELLAAWMAMNAAINRRIAPLHHVLVVAADADTDAAALLAATDDQRIDGAQRVSERLADLGGLKTGLEPNRAADIADVLIDPTLYRRLVELRGWSFPAYVEHLERIANASLLR
jgi:AcrR family transcriptional regulator